MGGTSMVTPLVAGAIALIRQFLRTKKKLREDRLLLFLKLLFLKLLLYTVLRGCTTDTLLK
jgi:hypothetical protein